MRVFPQGIQEEEQMTKKAWFVKTKDGEWAVRVTGWKDGAYKVGEKKRVMLSRPTNGKKSFTGRVFYVGKYYGTNVAMLKESDESKLNRQLYREGQRGQWKSR